MSTENRPKPHDPYPFLITPEQHRERAEEMLQMGRPDLAQHHENLARLIERRRRQPAGVAAG